MSTTTPRSRKRRHIAETSDTEDVVRPPVQMDTNRPSIAQLAGDIARQPLVTMLDDMKSIITCKICFRLLYEPYTISCGHTYCYSCLCQWFSNNPEGGRKTCPGCRSVVLQPPAPSFTIRETTQKFISFSDFLPTGESKEQHEQWGAQEAEIVERDKAIVAAESGGGGVFPGLFPNTSALPRPLPPIRDADDGVERCPYCTWELEIGQGPICAHCGGLHATDDDDDDDASFYSHSGGERSAHLAGFSDAGSEEVDDDDLDEDSEVDYASNLHAAEQNLASGDDYESEDSDSARGHFESLAHRSAPGRFGTANNRHLLGGHGRPTRVRIDGTRARPTRIIGSDEELSGDEDEDEEDNENSSMDGFIDDEAEVHNEESEESAFEEDDETGVVELEQNYSDGYDINPSESNASRTGTDLNYESDDTIAGRSQGHPQHRHQGFGRLLSRPTDSDASHEDSDEGGAVTKRHRRRSLS